MRPCPFRAGTGLRAPVNPNIVISSRTKNGARYVLYLLFEFTFFIVSPYLGFHTRIVNGTFMVRLRSSVCLLVTFDSKAMKFGIAAQNINFYFKRGEILGKSDVEFLECTLWGVM